MSSVFLVTMIGSYTRPCRWKRESVLEDEELKEHNPDRKEKTMTVSKSTRWLGLVEGGIKVSGDTGSNHHRSATAVQGNTGMFSFCEAIPKEKKRSLPRLTSELVYSRLTLRHLYCLTLEMVIQMNQLRMRLPLKFLFCFSFNMWCKCFICTDTYVFFLGHNRWPGNPSHHSLLLWENLSGPRSTVAEPPMT